MWVTRHFRVPLTFMVLLSVLWKLNGPRAKERNAKTQEVTKDMPTFCRRYFEECWNGVPMTIFVYTMEVNGTEMVWIPTFFKIIFFFEE